MSEIQIDRMSLEVPGLSASEGNRLALLVLEGLGAAGAAGGNHDIPALRLDLTVKPGTGVSELSQQIVAEILRELRRIP